MSMIDDWLIEPLAAYAHESWSGWMKYLFQKSTKNTDGTVTIPANLVARWTRQMDTRYHALPEPEQRSDNEEAHKILQIVKQRLGL